MTQYQTAIAPSKGIDNLLRDLGLDATEIAGNHPKAYVLLDYAVGERVGGSHLVDLEAHLAECRICRSEVGRLKASVSHPEELDRFQTRLRLIVENGLAAPKRNQTEPKATVIVVPRDWWVGPRAISPTSLALAAAESDVTTGTVPGEIIKWAIEKISPGSNPDRFGYRVYIASTILPAETIVMVGFTESDIAAHPVSLRPAFDTQVEGKTDFSADEVARLRPDCHQLRFEIREDI
jgi:hypothetical protein